jgi:hypothetical protein
MRHLKRGDMSNEVGRVKSDSRKFLILYGHSCISAAAACAASTLPWSSFFCAPTRLLGPVSRISVGVAHQTCLRSPRTMMTFSNSLLTRREAGSLIRRTVSSDHGPREAFPHRPHRYLAAAGDRNFAFPRSEKLADTYASMAPSASARFECTRRPTPIYT